MTMYIGLDVHSKQTVFLAQDGEGKTVGQGSVATTAEGLHDMLKTLGAPAGTRIGLETGTQATWVSRLLAAQGMAPVVIDAREVRAKARRVGQKSDRRDAFEICDGLRRGIYSSLVYIPPPEVERLRRIISRRRHFVNLRISQINAAKYLLRAVGLGGAARSLVSEKAWQELVEKPEVAEPRQYLEMHFEVWRTAQQQVQKLEKELAEALQPFSVEAERLCSVPGVGLITAATFLAVVATPERFPDSGHVASYIGLTPSSYDSGEAVRHGHITKRGSPELRAMLCEAAHHASKPTHPLNPYFTRVCAKAGYRKAVVCVAHRMARILYQMWRKEEEFEVAKLNVVREPRTRSRTLYYRLKEPQESKQSA